LVALIHTHMYILICKYVNLYMSKCFCMCTVCNVPQQKALSHKVPQINIAHMKRPTALNHLTHKRSTHNTSHSTLCPKLQKINTESQSYNQTVSEWP
jgi:hypothetical protein